MSGARFRDSIRFKLTLSALTLLVIPWAGIQYLQETESFLRNAQGENLSASARALALLVQSRTESVPVSPETTDTHSDPNLYRHELRQAPELDGFANDWEVLQGQEQKYISPDGYTSMSVRVASQDRHLYLMLEVSDRDLHYHGGSGVPLTGSDWVRLLFLSPSGSWRDYLLISAAPGPLAAKPLQFDRDGPSIGPPDYRIQGNWQESSRGYNLELRIPLELVNDRLAIQLNDVHQGGYTRVETSDLGDPGILVSRSEDLTRLLQQAGQPGERRWITNPQGLVLATSGSIEADHEYSSATPSWLLDRITSLILRHRAPEAPLPAADTFRLDDKTLLSALRGKPMLHRYRPPGSNNLVLVAAHPVWQQDRIIAAVVLEQTTSTLLSMQNQALQRLLLITLVLFLLVAVILLGFATLLTTRIRRLHGQVDSAVTGDGRIVSGITAAGGRDEIADLNRGFANVLRRLQEYNHYLEQMASRLTHELRTPLSIVRTSVDSCQQLSSDPRLAPFLDRAQQGSDRLERIIRQLREATRLEKSFADTHMEIVDIGNLISTDIRALQQVYPQASLLLELEPGKLMVNGAPDLISQALEKIVSNAIDFHRPGSGIRIRVFAAHDQVVCCVSNLGPLLAEGVDPLQSMISVRASTDNEPHLGLGLYLVRLIAEFHQGEVKIHNLDSGDGVSACLFLPAIP